MVQVTKNSPDIKVITKDGECHIKISLELTINVNEINRVQGLNIEEKQLEKTEDNPPWILPDFQTSKIDFGIKVNDRI